jgi:hypothetical protein
VRARAAEHDIDIQARRYQIQYGSLGSNARPQRPRRSRASQDAHLPLRSRSEAARIVSRSNKPNAWSASERPSLAAKEERDRIKALSPEQRKKLAQADRDAKVVGRLRPLPGLDRRAAG